MRAALGCLLVAAALAVWWLWESGPERARTAHEAVARRASATQPEGAPELDPERARLERERLASVTGTVSAHDRAVWGAQVRIHLAGDETAFDQTGTDEDGNFRLEFAVLEEGEDLDLSVLPPKSTPFERQRVEGLRFEPGTTLRRDVTLTRGPVLEGRVTGLWGSDAAVSLLAVPLEAWEESLPGADQGHPSWLSVADLARERVRASPEFQFTELEAGRFVLVPASDRYAILRPQAYSPGGSPVRLSLLPITTIYERGIDAATGKSVPEVQVEVVGATGPLTKARGATPLRARLRWDGFHEGKERTLRLSAEGYYPLELTESPGAFRQWGLIGALVPQDARRVTVQFTGSGAAAAFEAEVWAWRNAEPPNLTLRSHLPTLSRTPDSITFALPRHDWNLRFLGERIGNGIPLALPVTGSTERDQSIHIEVEEPAVLELDWTGVENPYLARVSAAGPVFEWQHGADGVQRVVAVKPSGGTLQLVLPSPIVARPRIRCPLPAGSWTIRWKLAQRPQKDSSRALVLAPGQVVKLRLAP